MDGKQVSVEELKQALAVDFDQAGYSLYSSRHKM
jgi:hypothetical protein